MCPARKYCLDQKQCPKGRNNHPRRQDDKYSFVKNPQLRKHNRKLFAMFLKILLRRLENDPREAFVLQNVKNVIQYHSWKLKGQRQKVEDTSSDSASETSSSSSSSSESTQNLGLEVEKMEAPIRSFVGETQWISAHVTMRQLQLRSKTSKTIANNPINEH